MRIPMGAAIALAVTGLLLSTITVGVLTANQTMPTSSSISSVNVGVYTDGECNNNCTSINWGSLAPGDTITKTVYVKNNGTIPLTLSLTTKSWEPSNAPIYLTVIWDREGIILEAGNSTVATLTLTASNSAANIKTFSFNIDFTGTE